MSEPDQYAFSALLDEMEAVEQSMIDDLRTQTQQWFDGLTYEQKSELAACVERNEWIAHAALAAAVGDWWRDRSCKLAKLKAQC